MRLGIRSHFQLDTYLLMFSDCWSMGMQQAVFNVGLASAYVLLGVRKMSFQRRSTLRAEMLHM